LVCRIQGFILKQTNLLLKHLLVIRINCVIIKGINFFELNTNLFAVVNDKKIRVCVMSEIKLEGIYLN